MTFTALDNNINKYKKVIIMSHLKPDLDALASSFGLYEILMQKDITPYIFLDKNDLQNQSVKDTISLCDNINYVNKDNYLDIIDEQTALIILDVHQMERLYYPDILDNVENVIVIDHHIKNRNYIKNTLVFYNNTLASSVSEIITYYAKYLEYKFSSIVATLLLSGIETDTNSYTLKTSSKTFLASSYLMEYGADNILKQELLKETKEEYLKRADSIKNSFMLNSFTAMCIIPKFINTNEEISSIAEEMLKFENVKLAVAIGKLEDNYIGISSKSIGDVDACKYMKMFNGGGHVNNAAAQVEKGNIRNIVEKIRKALEADYESNIN